jgi:hypothetical protein
MDISRKMEENQQKGQQPAETSGSTAAPAVGLESKSAEDFDEMSVEELNSLQPSERRRNMMEAIERRKAKAAQ